MLLETEDPSLRSSPPLMSRSLNSTEFVDNFLYIYICIVESIFKHEIRVLWRDQIQTRFSLDVGLRPNKDSRLKTQFSPGYGAGCGYYMALLPGLLFLHAGDLQGLRDIS